MIDFKINNKGDLVLADNKIFPRMRLDFFASQFPAIRVSFLQGNEETGKKPAGTQCMIRFNTRSQEFTNGKVTRVVLSDEEIKQRIMIALRTEYGDIITKPEFGSNVFRVKHLDINSPQVQRQLEDAIMDEIKDILEEPSVLVKPEYYEGNFFCQNINAYIFDNEKLVYKFSVME